MRNIYQAGYDQCRVEGDKGVVEVYNDVQDTAHAKGFWRLHTVRVSLLTTSTLAKRRHLVVVDRLW